MTEKQKIVLNGVINTLNAIEVKGKNNLDMLLGAILALENIDEEREDNG